jgi:hypothetical protein
MFTETRVATEWQLYDPLSWAILPIGFLREVIILSWQDFLLLKQV